MTTQTRKIVIDYLEQQIENLRQGEEIDPQEIGDDVSKLINEQE